MKRFSDCREELVLRFGTARLEETGFPAYFGRFWPASYLMWKRVFTAQRLLTEVHGRSVLDFGSGLGVLLPYLETRFREVVACDRDAEITEFMIGRLGLRRVQLARSISDCEDQRFDAIVALDVLEHVSNLRGTLESLEGVTAEDGSWVVSGPTENMSYRLGRRIAGTTGQGHIRTIYDVLQEIREPMTHKRQFELPSLLPFFLVALFSKGRSS